MREGEQQVGEDAGGVSVLLQPSGEEKAHRAGFSTADDGGRPEERRGMPLR
jgi:hypothetical protein